MRRFWCLLAVFLLLAAAGCGKKPGRVPAASAGVSSAQDQPAQPLHLETLTVELQRSAGDGAVLMRAVKDLPQLLRTALAEGGVTVEEVTVTIGSGAGATAEAILGGGVDAAILPATELAALEEIPRVLLAAGGEDGGAVGQRMLLCAADTEYGRNLASRASPTWTELDRACWGVVSGDLWGRDAVELWLADHYEGNGLADLSAVTVYGSWDALLDAAGQGQVDVFPATAALLEEGDYPLLGETERLYTMAVAVREELADSRFSTALAWALNTLRRGEYGALFGAEAYAAVPGGALDPQRRMAQLLG